tara:strand:+ start:156 stop:275 length:120 start_codon:yes stop_codon:yes gene_type:complete
MVKISVDFWLIEPGDMGKLMGEFPRNFEIQVEPFAISGF